MNALPFRETRMPSLNSVRKNRRRVDLFWTLDMERAFQEQVEMTAR